MYSVCCDVDLDGNPVRASFAQPVRKVGAIFREVVAAEGDSAVVGEKIGIQENLFVAIKSFLDVQHTAAVKRGEHGEK